MADIPSEPLGLTKEEILLCWRIEPEIFFSELIRFGFSESNAKSILKVLARLYLSDPIMFASKNKATIKAAVTYAVSAYLRLNHNLETRDSEMPSQIALVQLFGISNVISQSGSLKKTWPGFTPNIRQLFHLIVDQHREAFSPTLGGGWPDWVNDSTFHTSRWIHHKI